MGSEFAGDRAAMAHISVLASSLPLWCVFYDTSNVIIRMHYLNMLRLILR
jgi:hypothetical protein